MRLTLPQEDIYFEQLLYPDRPVYNIGARTEIRGKIDFAAFNKAYIGMISQHDICRSVLTVKNDSPEFCILDTDTADLELIDFSFHADPVNDAISYMQSRFLEPFRLNDQTFLHKIILLKIADDFHYLFSVYHHLITDGWGTSLMFRRLVQNYNELSSHGTIQSVYPYSYTEFAKDDAKYRASETYQLDKSYWTAKFSALPENVFVKNNSQPKKEGSRRKEWLIKRAQYDQLNELAVQLQATTFHLLLAIAYTYFGRIKSISDFAVGIPMLNRSGAAFKKTAGLFTGIIPLRINLDFEDSFAALVSNIRQELKQDYRHQRFPLGKLIQELNLFDQEQKLFDITLSYEKQDYSVHFKHTLTHVVPLTHQAERVALALYVREFDNAEDVRIDFDYSLEYFEGTQVTNFITHFQFLLEDILANPHKKLSKLDFLGIAEKEFLITGLNQTAYPYPSAQTVVDLFEEQVENDPDHVVVRDSLKEYTYLEASQKSNAIAAWLLAQLGEGNEAIAILVNRSADLPVLLMGIFKAGKSYVPIDPDFPEDRIAFIVENCKAKTIICENDAITIADVKRIHIADVFAYTTPEQLKINRAKAADSAYIIYTSGSTGRPKGVEIRHNSLANFLISMRRKPGLSPADLVFSITTISFDISILEFFGPLISGGTAYVVKKEVLAEPQKLLAEIRRVKPTVLQATPGFFQLIFNAGWEGDKAVRILCGGDQLSKALVEKLLSNVAELWNMYGPTETTVWSALKKIERPDQASNIGRPISNMRFYIVDHELQIVPAGTIGRIFIGGPGLSKGYCQNEELTAAKFISSPFIPGDQLYETGDLGKWTTEGEIEFCGRNDYQLKIRGYRIEPGEIETQLNRFLKCDNTVILSAELNSSTGVLVAYIPKQTADNIVPLAKEFLQNYLPGYMIPEVFVQVESFPLTANQKIDRKALLAMKFELPATAIIDTGIKTATEEKLLKIWKEELNLDRLMNIHDNFFSLGGHSLMAVQMTSAIYRIFNIRLTMKDVFTKPSISLLGKYIDSLNPAIIHSIEKASEKTYYKSTPAQQSIWQACLNTDLLVAYNMSAIFKINGIPDKVKIEQAILSLIGKHEILRTNFKEINGEVYQNIQDIDRLKFEVHVNDAVSAEEAAMLIKAYVEYEFDLANDLLLKIGVVNKVTGESGLIFLTHHLIMDGISFKFFVKDFLHALNGITPVEPEIQFKDYAEWYNNRITTQLDHQEFWNDYLSGYQRKGIFQKDFLENGSSKGRRVTYELSGNVLDDLKKSAATYNSTIFSMLFATFNLLIFKDTGLQDFCVGTVFSGRNVFELDQKIGMFVKTLPVRTVIAPEYNFRALVENTHHTLLLIDEHQDVIPEVTGNSYFDIVLVFQDPGFLIQEHIQYGDFSLQLLAQEEIVARLPMTFNFYEGPGKISCEVDYDASLYEPETIHLIWEKFLMLIPQLTSNPDQFISTYDIVLEIEKNKGIDIDFDF
ncbi:amino acid adenylation protein [Pedobacter cryoconitis]|uniref:Amino acid adenylation protein n=1 Tax=Pedobacter cryoconitis TaxID=188932 RepID=A0A127VDV4_9SPHI|nr:non-ribosomal peptide synthetase [Pedobacter cryoconitis]AMP99108.1 amino acid adenylation protein [Pedobacter cryoconitis]